MASPEEIHRILRTGSVFSELPAAELKSLAASCDLKLVESGSHLFRGGSPQKFLMHLAQGRMTLYRRNSQRDVSLLLGVVNAPSFVGDMEWAGGFPWSISGRAESDCIAVLIPRQSFERALEVSHDLCKRLYKDACMRHMLTCYTAQSIALYDVRSRLLGTFVELARRYGTPVDGGILVDLDVSLVDIAAGLGITRKTVTRTLQPLEKEGVVTRREPDRRFVLHDLETIAAELPDNMFGVSSTEGEPPLAMKDWLGQALKT